MEKKGDENKNNYASCCSSTSSIYWLYPYNVTMLIVVVVALSCYDRP